MHVFRVDGESFNGGIEGSRPIAQTQVNRRLERIELGILRVQPDGFFNRRACLPMTLAGQEDAGQRVMVEGHIGRVVDRGLGLAGGFVVLFAFGQAQREQGVCAGIIGIGQQALTQFLLGQVQPRLFEEHQRALKMATHACSS